MTAQPQADVRLYKQRASYSLHAALAIFHEAPVAHVAFLHPGDEAGGSSSRPRRQPTVMNLPLIVAIIQNGDDEDDEGSYVVYLHTHKHSGLYEAIERGVQSLTASTLKIDGMVLSPTPADHSLDYRSATLHLTSPVIMSDESQHEEKRTALAAVTNTVAGYDRVATVGVPDDPSTMRTTVIACKIAATSCKQRCGGWNSGKEPDLSEEEGPGPFKGVIPCWTQWGELQGYGRDRKEVEQVFAKRSEDNRILAEKCVWAHEDSQIDKLGQRRKK